MVSYFFMILMSMVLGVHLETVLVFLQNFILSSHFNLSIAPDKREYPDIFSVRHF